LPSSCLIIANVTYAINVCYLKCRHHLMSTQFKEHSSTVQSLTYPSEKLVETVGTAVTVLSKVSHLESIELYIARCYKEGSLL